MLIDAEKMSAVGRVDDNIFHEHVDLAQTSHVPDDIHQAALLDNPTKAERPSLTTILSILVRPVLLVLS